jgi:hypothetical protein
MQQEGVLDGQLRIGTSRAGKNGGKTPVKLDTWRITSKSRVAIVAAAAKFGGEARPWDSDRGPQWEVVTPLSELPVEFGGGATVDQWMTHYDRGVLVRRCTGADDAIDEISGRPCECNATTGRELCKPETKLRVRFLDLPGIGWWRFTSHGIFVAAGFPAKAEFLVKAEAHLNAVAAARGDFEAKYVPARLVLGEMKLPPKEPGGPGRRFPVVDIDIDVSVAQVLAGEGVGTLREIVAARRPLTLESGGRPALPAAPQAPPPAARAEAVAPAGKSSASDEPPSVRAQRCADAALKVTTLDGRGGLRDIGAWASQEGLLDEWVLPTRESADSLLRDVLTDAMERLTLAATGLKP